MINAGVAGYDSFESLINLEFRVLDLEPDLIIIYHGTNDVHSRLVVPSAYKGDNSARRKQWSLDEIPLIDHSCFLRIIRTKLGYRHQAHLGSYTNEYTYKGAGSVGYDNSNSSLYKELLRQNPPVYFERNLINMIAIARANNCGVLLATWAHSSHFSDYASTEHYEQGYNENNLVVRRIAKAYDVPMFDFAEVMPQSKQLWSDGRHVNSDGAMVKALLFAGFIDTANLIDANKPERKNCKIKAKDRIDTTEHDSKGDETWRLQKISTLLPPLKIVNYGPKESRLGEPFNLQPTGNSAIWIQGEGVRNNVKIVFNGEKLSSAVSGQSLSAEIPSALLQKAGKIEIYLIDELTGKTSRSVYLNLTSP